MIAWISIFLTLILLKRLNNSPWGRALRAVREDEDAVRAMGKNAVWLKLQSFMLGAGIAGLSGVLLAFNYGSLETTVFVPLLTFYVWAIMILGGVGSLGSFTSQPAYVLARTHRSWRGGRWEACKGLHCWNLELASRPSKDQ